MPDGHVARQVDRGGGLKNFIIPLHDVHEKRKRQGYASPIFTIYKQEHIQ